MKIPRIAQIRKNTDNVYLCEVKDTGQVKSPTCYVIGKTFRHYTNRIMGQYAKNFNYPNFQSYIEN